MTSIQSLAKLSLLLVATAFFMVGCGDDPLSTQTQEVGGDNSMEEIDLNEEFGALAFEDEVSGFGDEQLLTEATAADLAMTVQDDEADVVADEPELRDDPQIRRSYLKILWGQLDGRPEDAVTDALSPELLVDWTGGVSVEGGVVAVKRTILFEWPFDRLVPRLSRSEVNWISHTGPHIDGILLCILSRPDSTGAHLGSVTFDTGPLTKSFRLSELDGLDQTISVDEFGNAVSFVGNVPDDICPKGFLRGYWKHVEGTNGGFFRGIWMSENGMAMGFLMGRYGVNDAGERVMAGKYISRTGRIQGLIHGSWEPSGDGDGTGSFMARWVNRFGQLRGSMGGEYETRDGGGAGFFKGRWAASCIGTSAG